jgi:hypothetical protein
MLSIEEAIDKGLKKFVNKQEELLGVQGILSEWKAKVLLFVQKRTRASFVVQTSADSSLSVPLGDLDHLKILQQSFVITYVDKCCNNFVFVCKKFYVSSVFSELNLLVLMWSPILLNLLFLSLISLLIMLIILKV